MKQILASLARLALAACGGGDDGANLPGLVATKRAPVTGPGGCGVRDAWVVTEVAGVQLSRPAIMTMQTARSLDRWVRSGAVPAIGRRGGGLVELTVASHYACRSRNSRPGARLSEHAQGRAIDISSFVLASGERISVLRGWRGDDSRVLRRMHRAACGPFGTVLGPDADRHHQDHFHFDVADYRSGPYCR